MKDFVKFYRKLPLFTKLFAGLIIGGLIGFIWGPGASAIAPIGTVFLRLLRMAALPLIIVNLISGIASLDDPKIFGRVGGKILLYYMCTTVFAMIVGIAAAYILRPGIGFKLEGEYKTVIEKIPSFGDTIINLIPVNVFEALATNRFDQIVVFSAFCGVAIIFLPKEVKAPLAQGCANLATMFNRLIGMIMGIAPFGILALMANTVGKYGKSMVGVAAKYVGATYLAVLLMIGVYLVLLVVFSKRSPIDFLKKAAALIATTASTSSSVACVPVNLECADNLGVSRGISGFTIPLGTQINKDGNGIMLAIAVLFAAQAAGVPMPITTLVNVILLGLILTTGAGGVPGGGIVSIAIIIDAFGLPIEVVAIIAGIFALIDMGLTTLNCLGDLAGTVIVADSEKKRGAKN